MVTRAQVNAAASAESARKIASDSELREIAAAGAGFIIDPFNRRWHAATCPRITAMSVGQPKWYAATSAALESFLEQRLARHATAQPIRACTTCGENAAARRVPPRAPSLSARNTATGPQVRSPDVRRTDSGFEVWAHEYVRNESTAVSTAGQLRQLIAAGIRGLAGPAGCVLHAGYGGQRWRGTDVENLLFNNMDQTLALFSKPGGLGIRFEDLGLHVPSAPDGAIRQSYYRYRLARPDEAFTAVEQGHLICHVPKAVVSDGPGPARLAARIWLAVRRARPLPAPGIPVEDGSFLLRITLHQLEPAASLKAVVDGVTAAMQRDDASRISEAMTRLTKLLHADSNELLALATGTGAPLGTRSRSGPVSKQALFTLGGRDQVRVTPDDDRCLAAEVLSAGKDGPARLSVEVYAATHRSTGAWQA